MANHAVVRTDLMYATDVRSGLVSIKYINSNVETAIENGNVLKVGSLMDGEREVYAGATPAASDKLTDIVLIASVEMMYDERLKNLDDFINEAGAICRGYRLHSGDVFSVTAPALDGLTDTSSSPAVGKAVTLKAGTKLAVAGSGTAVGKIIAKDIVGRHTYYVIKVD